MYIIKFHQATYCAGNGSAERSIIHTNLIQPLTDKYKHLKLDGHASKADAWSYAKKFMTPTDFRTVSVHEYSNL